MSPSLIARSLAAALALAAVVAVAGSASGAAPQAKGGRSCHLTPREQRHLGASYVTSLRVSHTSCSNGKKVTKAFHTCRHKSGGPAGHCRHAVRRYHCRERRFDKLPHVQYDGKVTCTRGAKRVKSTYTQNL
jgi:hypothetical protein